MTEKDLIIGCTKEDQVCQRELYKKYAGNIFAKTGTLSNNCALSGYLITNKGKLLIFSILNNNYITGATPVRKAVEKFLVDIIEKY